ncbi:MAG: hypothetical protein JWQ09_5597 [Segetibacter sp.]|nr:hypothetical protein [Segetibacter sp.]
MLIDDIFIIPGIEIPCTNSTLPNIPRLIYLDSQFSGSSPPVLKIHI